ncbi:MAG: mannosyl-glycoprotein endo-beta-N-acetylglucosamidase [Epsilonproteobacteria bacterium]|nr:mannosyl-glycoprotein endo-beta-N-acetylglucosamidase [Campylobacterota bacterium]NPA56332.1 mannosyl-glycoprotein endo-beta-N-acetylglucosamidase [Campylobacterota bacterium]
MVLLMVTALVQAAEYRKIPDWYYKIKSVKVQKKAFFDILRPLVEEENQKILEERAFVKEVFQEMESKPIIEDEKLVRLAQIAKKYRIKDIYNESEYMMKVDSLPVSLVLAQAALESGWGKSRFARQANNLFGEWTWGKKGLIPKRRDPGKRHKIKIFDSLRDSIASYMLNLNRHRAYREFRVARYVAKKTRRSFSGLEAATTMKRYSGIGRRYTRLVSSIIKRNRLHLD